MNLIRRISTNTLAAFGPSLIVVAFGAFIFYNIELTRRIESRVDNHNESMLQLESLLREARTVQVKARGYAISGSAVDRSAYQAAVDSVMAGRATVAGWPAVAAQLDSALAVMAAVVAAREQGQDAALAAIANDGERQAMERLTLAVHAQLAREQQGMRAVLADRREAARLLRVVFIIGAVMAALLAWALNRMLVARARREQQGQLALGAATTALEASEERRRVEVLERELSIEKEKEAEVRKREDRFNALLAQSAELIALVDGAGMITFVSPSLEPILGLSSSEVVDRPAEELVHPADAEMLGKLLAEAAQHPREPIPMELRVRHGDGSWRAMQGTLTNLLGDPAVDGIIVNSRDVSDTQRIEQQYRQSQKMDAVGRLAGGIAHDFNNLLTAMTGHIGFALEDLPQDSPVRADIEQIAYAAGRAASLTRQLLTFSRQQQQSVTEIDLNQQIKDFSRMISRVIGERIEIRMKMAGQPIMVRMDPGQLDQVLMNLAINARDAMPDGGTLTVETRLEARDQPWPGERSIDPGNYAMLSVSDTGIGMTAEIRERVFEPFFTTKPTGKGTGLGLATVYGIVKQNGGHIFVYSEPGAGSAFKVFLPTVATEPAPITETRPAAAGAGEETILVVEDEMPVRSLIVRALRKFGYNIIEAHNGRDALRLLERYDGNIDLLLSDVVMPHMQGPELVKQALQVRPGLPVVLMSGYADTDIQELPGNVRYIDKPFTVDFLARTLRAVLDQKQPPA